MTYDCMKAMNTLRFFALGLLFFALFSQVSAQKHEYGGWLGISQYYGDLNTSITYKDVRPGGGLYYKYVLGEYIQLRAGANFGMIAFSDANTSLVYQTARNLSFRSILLEGTGIVEFNFQRFEPGHKRYKSTPYLALGLSLVYFNPQAYFNDQWVNLRDLGTEGQQIGDLTGRSPYKSIQPAIPVGLGYKYYIGNNYTLGFEFLYRFVFTDYLDDVSTQFVNDNILGNGTATELLADRSGELGIEIGEAGRQRGNSVDNDAFLFFGVTLTRTIFRVYCP